MTDLATKEYYKETLNYKTLVLWQDVAIMLQSDKYTDRKLQIAEAMLLISIKLQFPSGTAILFQHNFEQFPQAIFVTYSWH